MCVCFSLCALSFWVEKVPLEARAWGVRSSAPGPLILRSVPNAFGDDGLSVPFFCLQRADRETAQGAPEPGVDSVGAAALGPVPVWLRGRPAARTQRALKFKGHPLPFRCLPLDRPNLSAA